MEEYKSTYVCSYNEQKQNTFNQNIMHDLKTLTLVIVSISTKGISSFKIILKADVVINS